jgi:hypothetical protein
LSMKAIQIFLETPISLDLSFIFLFIQQMLSEHDFYG